VYHMSGSDADAVVDLRTEFDCEPENAPPESVRFSWRVATDERGASQTAYRVFLARSREAAAAGRGEVWDSGRVESDRSTNVTCPVSLEADATYHWTVRVWDGDGTPAEPAEPARFGTALGGAGDFDGEWIGHQPGAGDSNGYRSRWGKGESEWVQVDLGESRRIDAVELHPTDPFGGPETPDGVRLSSLYAGGEDDRRQGAAGFGFPVRYRVEVADDPDLTDATTVVDRTDEAVENPGSDAVTHDAAAEGRYVRVTATEPQVIDPAKPDEGPFKPDLIREEYAARTAFALSALAVRADGEDAAVGADVTASSSVEAESWGREHLVDGAYGPEMAATSPLLRTEIELSKPVARARVHVSTLGYGELYLNGGKVGDAVLDPGWTTYDERTLYSTYDVTDRLESGENAIGLWLGRGWFGKHAGDWTARGSPRALLRLTVEYEDGTTRRIHTDPSWTATASPVVENDIYDGEVYDARREHEGWAAPGFDDAAWADAAPVDGPGGDLTPQRSEPMRVTETFDPVEITAAEDGPIVDFGQNVVGWVELSVEGADAGDAVTLGHAENLLEDGSLNRIDLRSAAATDTYVARGDGVETYEPRFTYHGFRYAQVIDYPGELDPEDVTAKAVHTDFEPVGEFDCANEELAQVQHNAEWGLRGNAHSVPTDCPQRDERLGWTGDGHISARAFLYNFDALGFHEKWARDHDDTQSPGGYVADTVPFGFGTIPEDRTWGITRVTIPWHLYRHHGDVGVLERHYEAMRRYVDYWHEESDGGVLGAEYGNYGDWLAFENSDGRRGLPLELFNTAFHYHTVNVFARIAGVLDRTADAERYRAMAEETKAAFEEAFFDPGSASYGPGTQSSYAVPLFVGLVPDEHEQAVADALAETVEADGGRLRTGFLGSRPLIHVLAEHGYPDLAYEVVSQPERPGWVYMVRQGATTTWERWDSDDRVGDGMNSFNHSPFNFVSEWLFAELAGIDFDDSVAEGLRIAPAVVDDLEWAGASLETVDGEVRTRWEHTDEGLVLEATVPWNTTASVRLPAPEGATVTESETGAVVWDGAIAEPPAGIVDVSRTGEAVVVEVGAGSYSFVVA